ncbi:doublecortin domain-containing protein 2C-like [Stylophora pistillata]|uniref:Doublecortin domain-containing protein 2 n=1 Tax=Stylophora pistillata TaxID=50429 RepID=A0A2B4RKZ7_STYPI|nr:doublecortin domain-containing protein 2C-like [Stylophora pistillata]PFX17170.1 Doublecortin domain-containing protein 2 [Stylophora pistillata]
MAATAWSLSPTVTVKVYKNGNPNFLGKTLVINRRHIRNMEALYDEVTMHISAFNAVRKICTPIGGRPVQSLENIKNKSVYVAAGRECFKKLNYADLGIRKPRPPRKANNSPKKAIIVAEGRHKMDYEWAKRDLKIIHVFCNGDVFKPSVKIVLQKRLQQSMEQILGIVQEHVFLAAAIVLYTIDGKLIFTPSQLISGQNYVAVERGRMFKRVNYGAASSLLAKSPRGPFLPMIGNGQLTNPIGRSYKKISKRKPQVTKTNAQSKSIEHSRGNQSSVTTMIVESPRDVISNVSPDLPVATSLLRASQDIQDSFTISASPPAQLEGDTPVQEYTARVIKQTDNDDSLVADSVFKASGLQQEKAAEIRDSHQTKEEKPLDLLPAEEVLEEVLQEVKDTKTSIENSHVSNKDEAHVKEIEDDVEVIEDDSNLSQVADKTPQFQAQAWQYEESQLSIKNSDEEIKNSRLPAKEDRENPSPSAKDRDETSSVDDIPIQRDMKEGKIRSDSSPKQKPANFTDEEEEQNSSPASETDKSENEDSDKSVEENEDDDEKENQMANNELESSNPRKFSKPDKTLNGIDKTNYIS